MNTYKKHHIDIEHHQIDLALAHIRICDPKALRKLLISMDANGQINPVIVVPSADNNNRYTLIDGYLRVGALKKLKQDTIKAEVWECTVQDALIALLANGGQRQSEAIEQAFAFRELQIRYHLSHNTIALRIGRTQAFVSGRIALLESLPDKFIQAIVSGKISAWSAQRILVPIARAIPQHAEQLFEYLQNHPVSTRLLSQFFKHYQRSSGTIREKMTTDPALYFKAQKEMDAESNAKLLRAGPEGQWFKHAAIMQSQIKYMEKLATQLFYHNQEEGIMQQLLLPLRLIQHALTRISQQEITCKQQEQEQEQEQKQEQEQEAQLHA